MSLALRLRRWAGELVGSESRILPTVQSSSLTYASMKTVRHGYAPHAEGNAMHVIGTML